MNKFIQPSFYFDAYIKDIHLPTMWVIIGVFALFLIIGLASLFWASKKEKTNSLTAKFFGKLSNWGLWTGIIGLFIAFFRYQRSPYLGMRFWLVAWFLTTLVWLVFVLKFFIKDIPRLKKEKIKKQEFKKYLPK